LVVRPGQLIRATSSPFFPFRAENDLIVKDVDAALKDVEERRFILTEKTLPSGQGQSSVALPSEQ